jgi:hypothetical protein
MTAQVRRLPRSKDPHLILSDMEEPVNDAVRLATACIMIAHYGKDSPLSDFFGDVPQARFR